MASVDASDMAETPQRWDTLERAPAQRPPSPLHRLLNRLFLALPYPFSVRIVRSIGVPWCRQSLSADEWVRLCRSFSRVAIDDRAVRRHLLTAYLGIHRLRALSRSSWPRGGGNWFAVSGVGHLHSARAAHRNVVLVNSHYGAVQCVPLLVARLGFRLASIECCDPFAALRLSRPNGLAVIPTAGNFLAKAALEAKRSLDEDGMLCIAADGYVGHSGITLAFHGRARRFAAGFAELAIGANAAVVPALAPIDDEGRITLEIFEAFEEEDPSAPHGERVRSLIRQYARWLENRWAEDPGNVFNIQNFAALPAWQPR